MLKILQKTLTHIWWFGIFLTMDFDFLEYRRLQRTHMDPLKPSGIFWTKFGDLEQGVPPSLSKLKVLPSFCFAFKIPDDRAVTITYWVMSSGQMWLGLLVRLHFISTWIKRYRTKQLITYLQRNETSKGVEPWNNLFFSQQEYKFFISV